MPTTYTKTWIPRGNYAVLGGTLLAQGQDLWFQIKQFLTGVTPLNASGSWSVVSSSDGVGGFGNTDRWVAAANLIWAAAGTNHSWIVLQRAAWMPGGTVYIIIDCNNATAEALSITICSSVPTAGSATAAPTAASSVGWNTATLGARQQYMRTTFAANNPTASALTLNMTRETAGGFSIKVCIAGAGYVPFDFKLLETERWYPATDNWPLIALCNYLDSGQGASMVARYMTLPAAEQGFNGDGSPAASVRLGAITVGDGNTTFLITQSSAGSALSPNYPDGTLEAVVYNGTQATRGKRGRVIDIRQGPSGTGVLQGTVEPPAPATPVSALFGDFWEPCNFGPII